MGDEILDGFLLTIVFIGISAFFSGHLGPTKNYPQNSPPHSCLIRQVSEAGFPTDSHWSASGDRPAICQTAYAKSCQQWEASSLDGLGLFSSRGGGSPCRGNTCGKQNCYNIVLLFFGSFVGSSQGCVQVTVTGR